MDVGAPRPRQKTTSSNLVGACANCSTEYSVLLLLCRTSYRAVSDHHSNPPTQRPLTRLRSITRGSVRGRSRRPPLPTFRPRTLLRIPYWYQTLTIPFPCPPPSLRLISSTGVLLRSNLVPITTTYFANTRPSLCASREKGGIRTRKNPRFGIP